MGGEERKRKRADDEAEAAGGGGGGVSERYATAHLVTAGMSPREAATTVGFARAADGGHCLWQQDGARAHTVVDTSASRAWRALRSAIIASIDGWPLRSPDPSPIDRAWARAERQERRAQTARRARLEERGAGAWWE